MGIHGHFQPLLRNLLAYSTVVLYENLPFNMHHTVAALLELLPARSSIAGTARYALAASRRRREPDGQPGAGLVRGGCVVPLDNSAAGVIASAAGG